MNIICKILFGSDLYGTATKDSDKDYKGIFMPSMEQILLGKIPKSVNLSTNKTHEKNSKEDVDSEFYSLHYFIELACKGETVAIDMLHANEKCTIETSPVWEEIIKNRYKFYTKNLKAFVGYARRQAAKYGIKGSRLAVAKEFLEVLKKETMYDCFPDHPMKLGKIWGELPIGEHSKFIEDSPNGTKQYQICGKILQSTIKCSYAYGQIEHFYKNYGERAKQAAENKGLDYKSLSHAFRAAFQLRELFSKNTITFPRPEANFLLKVKNGELDYNTQIAPALDLIIKRVDTLSQECDFPEKVNRKYWDEFIVRTTYSVLCG
jgi:hypothetical protein